MAISKFIGLKMSIGEVSFYTGILLFLIGVIGGGVDIKEVKIPEIAGAPRYMCFIGSILFLVMGLQLNNHIHLPFFNTSDPTVANTATSIANTPAKAPESAVNPTQAVVTPTPPAIDSTTPVTETPDTPENIAPSAELIADKKAAQKELDEANKRIDVVWNSTSKAIRDELLLEQRQWLKKRETDCALEASTEEPNINKQDAVKLRCMAAMSDPRIAVLSPKIATMTASETQPTINTIDQKPAESPRIANSINISVDANAATKAAQAELDEANKRLNAVWNATTKAIRDELLPEQRQWLKKREENCALEATANEPNVNMQQVFKLHCMATMTDPRTEELDQIITDMIQ
jgi:uncharacterized protein YecT (DUF1311 family)